MQHKFTKNNNKIRQAFSIYGGMDMEEVVRELSRKYYKKEKVIKMMIEKCAELGYNTEKTKGLIK